MGQATLILTPPPLSQNRRRGEHWSKTRRRKGAIQQDVHNLLLAEGVPHPIPGGRVRVTARLVFAKRRRRDEGNYRDALEKAIGDTLDPHDRDAPIRWLDDDQPPAFTFGLVTFDVEPGLPIARAEVTLAWGEDLAAMLQAEAAEVLAAVESGPEDGDGH